MKSPALDIVERAAKACRLLLEADGAGIGTEFGNALLAEAVKEAKRVYEEFDALTGRKVSRKIIREAVRRNTVSKAELKHWQALKSIGIA